MFTRPQPIHTLPAGYQRAYYLNVLEGNILARLNLLGLAAIVPFFLLGRLWMAVIQGIRGHYAAELPVPGFLLAIALVFGVIILHELIHGAAIRWAGHTPRYGVLRMDGIPAAFYATTDNAYFPRDVFIVIALAPLVVITFVGAALMVFVPDSWGYLILLGIIVNGAGAVGDLYMTYIVLKFDPAHTLVEDNMEAITIFVRPVD